MMQAPRTVGRILLLLWFMHGMFSYLFTTTKGLAYSDADSVTGISYVRELQSSGGDDNICMGLGIVFAGIALFWGVLRLKTRFGVTDFTINTVLIGLQTLFLLTMEMGSVVDTIVLGKNVVLVLWMLTYIALCGSLVGTFAVGIVKRVRQ